MDFLQGHHIRVDPGEHGPHGIMVRRAGSSQPVVEVGRAEMRPDVEGCHPDPHRGGDGNQTSKQRGEEATHGNPPCC